MLRTLRAWGYAWRLRLQRRSLQLVLIKLVLQQSRQRIAAALMRGW